MEEIGRRLQATRVAKGLTLQEVEDETRIRKKYIEALESGRTASIPGEVYVKGFLRTYGNFLGLDGESLVEEYKVGSTPDPSPGETTAAAVASPKAPDPEPLVTRTGPPRPPAFVSPPPRVGSRRAEREGRRGRASTARGPGPLTFAFRRIMVTLLVLVPIVGAGYWLFGQMSSAPGPTPPPPVTQKEDPPATPDPKPEPAPEPAPPPEPPKPKITMSPPQGEEVNLLVSAAEVDLKMEFKEGFPWMQVIKDGQILFEGKPAGPIQFKGKNLRVRFGFIAGLQLNINGEPFPHGLEGGPYWLNFKAE